MVRICDSEQREPRNSSWLFSFSWEQREVNELLVERNEQAPQNNQYPLMAFIANIGVAPKGERYDRSALVNDTENKFYKRTEYGDFIYSSNNLETGSIGLNQYGKASISPVYSIFSPTGLADSDFIGRRMVRKDFIHEMVKWRQGVIYGQWRIHESDFLKIPLMVPILREQRKIGAFLDHLDRLLTLHQRKYDKLSKIKKSMLEKLFPKNGSNVPEIRFSGFTDAWEQREVNELLVERNEQAPQNNQYPLMAFIANIGVAPKGERYDRSALVNDTENKFYKRTEYGDFIYSSNNLETGSIGLNQYGKASISPVYSIFSPTGLADSDFIGRRMVRKDFIHEMVKWRQGVIYGQWRIHESDFLKIPLMVPILREQRKIGAFLDHLDRLLTLHQRKYDKLSKIKKSMLEKLFPKNGSNVPEIRFSGFTDAWEQREFEKSFSLLQNNTLSRAELSESSGVAANIHYGDVLIKFGEYLDMLQESFPWIKKQADADKFRTSFLQDGDIVFADTAEDETAGKCCEIRNCGSTVIISGLHTIPCRPVSKFAPGYLGYYLNSAAFHEQLVPLMQGTKVVSISKAALESTLIQYPSDDKEQQKIGALFRGIDRLITLHQREYLLFEVLLC